MDTGADTTLAGYPDRIFWGFNYKLISGTVIGLGHEWLGDPGSMVGRTVLGVSSELAKNTYAYANYGVTGLAKVFSSVVAAGAPKSEYKAQPGNSCSNARMPPGVTSVPVTSSNLSPLIVRKLTKPVSVRSVGVRLAMYW